MRFYPTLLSNNYEFQKESRETLSQRKKTWLVQQLVHYMKLFHQYQMKNNNLHLLLYTPNF